MDNLTVRVDKIDEYIEIEKYKGKGMPRLAFQKNILNLLSVVCTKNVAGSNPQFFMILIRQQELAR